MLQVLGVTLLEGEFHAKIFPVESAVIPPGAREMSGLVDVPPATLKGETPDTAVTVPPLPVAEMVRLESP